MLDTQLEKFKARVSNRRMIKDVEADVEELKKWIDASQFLPKLWKDIGHNFDFEHEVEQLVDRESIVDIRVEIEKEVEDELKRV